MNHFFKTFGKFLFCWVAVIASTALIAQTAVSPFDLLPRVQGGNVADTTIAITTSSNPFDLVETQPAHGPSASSAPGFTVVRPKKALTAKEKEDIYSRFLFITILTMLVILTLTYTIFRILIEKIWKAFLNDNLLNQLMREQGAGLTLAYLVLYFLFFINSGIFLFLVCKHLSITPAESNFVSLLICTGGLLSFFLFKHLLLQVVGYVFPVRKEINIYNFTIIIFNIIIGFFLVPAILFTAYAPDELTDYVIYGTAGLIVLTYLFRGLRGLFIANRFLAWHKFHFLLYLCAVEIAPLLIVAKLLMMQQSA